MKLFESVQRTLFFQEYDSRLHINENRRVSFSDPLLTRSWEIPVVPAEDRSDLYFTTRQIKAMRKRAKAYKTRAVKFLAPEVTARHTIPRYTDDEVQRSFYSTEEIYQSFHDFYQLVNQIPSTDLGLGHVEESKQLKVNENKRNLYRSNEQIRAMRESALSVKTRAVKFSVPEVTASKTIRRFTDNEAQRLFYSTDEIYQCLQDFHQSATEISSTDSKHVEDFTQSKDSEIDRADAYGNEVSESVAEKVVSVQSLLEYLTSPKHLPTCDTACLFPDDSSEDSYGAKAA